MKKLLFFFILVVAVISVKYSLKEPRVNTLLLAVSYTHLFGGSVKIVSDEKS